MAAAVNGLALHGGIVKPYGSTFLQFADYMRPAIRLSALMGLGTVWVFSHDSLGLGEDGPTHQPVEHLAALRAIPGLTVIRPATRPRRREAWRVALEEVRGPACLILSRQNLPVLDRAPGGAYPDAAGLARGAYVLAEAPVGSPAVATIVGDRLRGRGLRSPRATSWPARASSCASSRCRAGSCSPRRTPPTATRSCRPTSRRSRSRPGISQGWERWVDHAVAVDRFGASAPGEVVLRELGISVEATVAAVRALLT